MRHLPARAAYAAALALAALPALPAAIPSTSPSATATLAPPLELPEIASRPQATQGDPAGGNASQQQAGRLAMQQAARQPCTALAACPGLKRSWRQIYMRSR